jgi:hypothetical protein
MAGSRLSEIDPMVEIEIDKLAVKRGPIEAVRPDVRDAAVLNSGNV